MLGGPYVASVLCYHPGQNKEAHGTLLIQGSVENPATEKLGSHQMPTGPRVACLKTDKIKSWKFGLCSPK